MEKPKIVLVYSNGAGQNVRVDALPQPGETLRARSWEFDRDGGKGTNVAVALGRLGMPVALVARNGDDICADLCGKWLREAGVDTTFVQRDPSIATATGVVFIDSEGRNTIVLSDYNASIPKELIEEALRANKGAELFITGFEIAEDSALYAMGLAKSLGMKTIVNPSPVPPDHPPDLSCADIIIANEVEAKQLLAAKGLDTSEESSEQAARLLCGAYGVPAVVLTLGSKGYLGWQGSHSFAGGPAGASGDEVVDTSGAGDGFLAAMAYKLAQDVDLPAACQWANHYAGITVRFSGTIPGYRPLSEVKKFLPTP